MSNLWTEHNRFQKWLDVEVAVCEIHAEMGTIPTDAVEQIKAKAAFSVDHILEVEKVTRHDVIAFTTVLAENIGPASRYVHFGLTSSDVVDTANGLLLRDAADLLIKRVRDFAEALKKRAIEFRDTPMMGRTHGIHAEPTTFGLVMALYYADTMRNLERLERAREAVAVGKISGAVGTFANLDPEVEERVCARLGLKAAPISTQVIQRDRYAEFMNTLALIAAGIEKFALEIRHLQRTEVREAQEPFAKGQKGSSAMPHKRNPILSEQLCGQARLVRSNAMAAMENIALWHERDISHSSVERVILPDTCILVDYMLAKATGLAEGLVVYPDNMLKNLNQLGGTTFSGQLLLELARKGATREQAYEWVQRNAMKMWDHGADFRSSILEDTDITGLLSRDEIEAIFDLKVQLRNVDKIFKRVFGE